ncbi:unnamed protein product [Candidula unifasciata]|uniref:NADH-cytochrome b5 reductase n=1 Tax=Candidula unifasciata TaxID=100452 RepID=A0A8S3Z6V8_9EUPU|nr:unnamed protein product [Candidula unifasciata]
MPDLPECPLLPDPLEHPLLLDPPEHPLLADPLEHPLLPDSPEHPQLPDPPECPLLPNPSKCQLLPDPPERPLDSDCCGGGCIPCVMDIYREELALWEADCQRLLAGTIYDGEVLKQQELMLHPSKYTHFPVQDIKPEAVDCVRIRCGLARHQTLGLSLGQHIIVRSQVSGSPVTRQYTPISPLDAKGYFELLIKIYPGGRMSQRVAAWKVGHELEARGPAGQLAYVRNKFRRVLMLCAGTGVAPMCQVAQSVLADADDETFLRLVYAGRSYHHLIAKSEIQEWQRFWNFSCLYILSQEPVIPTYKYKRGEEIYRGHIDKDIILREMAGGDIDKTLVLICGPRSFNKDMVTYLTDMGVSETNIHQY